ncbi:MULTISPECIES: hypothetical protein [Pseudoalteromonas]|uniref:hypothetical protein n=1 Tax=Pseudoalteromonas TaxID=53246 RepID=UPI001B35D06C|nr:MULTISPECIES: hypothetical protein [Pseudoalteromonas]MBQ4838826.1 hypothetical protein [Pseudoalteromonas luteoviolacea]MCG7548568.1 hypothetical protein [Pseudoalteromonas sp. Of7M-16]
MSEPELQHKKSLSDLLLPMEIGEVIYIEVSNKKEATTKMRQATTTSRLRGVLKTRTFETSSFTAVPSDNCPTVQYLVRVVRKS